MSDVSREAQRLGGKHPLMTTGGFVTREWPCDEALAAMTAGYELRCYELETLETENARLLALVEQQEKALRIIEENSCGMPGIAAFADIARAALSGGSDE